MIIISVIIMIMLNNCSINQISRSRCNSSLTNYHTIDVNIFDLVRFDSI